jgi:hypothetical protein
VEHEHDPAEPFVRTADVVGLYESRRATIAAAVSMSHDDDGRTIPDD